MSRIVPVAYILTNEAIQECVTSDPDWVRLNDVWTNAGGPEKQSAYQAVSAKQEEITSALFGAVAAGQLPVLALARSSEGKWSEHALPREYWEKSAGDLALWTGAWSVSV